MEFLKSLTSHQALETVLSFPIPTPEAITVDLADALDCVLADDIKASENIPPLPRSLVDGFAVHAPDTYGAKETAPAFLQAAGEVRIGERPAYPVRPGTAVAVATGAVVPEGADSVIMEEYVRRSQGAVEITRPLRKGENICFPGEDIAEGDTVLWRGKTITSFNLGVLAALGVTRVPVISTPRVVLFSSGNEIVDASEEKGPEQVRDINRHTITGLLQKESCSVQFLGIARDTVEDVMEKLSSARNSDLILISAGSSKGAGDVMGAAVEGLGGQILFHGINIKPGKPTIFASLFGKPLFGLPGHPASCVMVFIRFVLPLIRRLKGEQEDHRPLLTGALTSNIPSSYGIEEYVRVKVEFADREVLVSPLFAKSSVISLLSQADGYVVVPEGREGLETGEPVEVYPFG